MSKKIFFSTAQNISDDYYPKPASRVLPEWYKKTPGYIEDNQKRVFIDKETNATIKKCIPVFDALSTGYIIKTHCEIFVTKDDKDNFIYVPSDRSINIIDYHPISQAPYHPSMNHYPYPKFINPWHIKTPPGYSCLFINPVHSSNKYFSILEGVVDTDKYFNTINFPFVLNDINFTGIIPVGTPVVQVIPFKRDSWEIDYGNSDLIKDMEKTSYLLKTKFYDKYKTIFWSRKSFK